MEEVYYSGRFDRDEMSKINRVRLYLKELTLSGITTSDGKQITHEAYDGVDEWLQPSTMRWPNQIRPPKSNWKTWQHAIDTLFVNNRTRREPLGQWIMHPHQLWSWFVDEANGKLYHKEKGGVITKNKLSPTQLQTRSTYFSNDGRIVLSMPQNAVPVSHGIHQHYIRCLPGDMLPRT